MNEIAVIGLAGRFPGAPDVEALWRNLRDGVESVSRFAPDELESSVLVPPRLRDHPDFVPAGGVLAGGDGFDRELFGVTAREARWMDPQQRVFLEVAWAALEDAGYPPLRLTATELALLVALARAPERVFTKQELLRDVWG